MLATFVSIIAYQPTIVCRASSDEVLANSYLAAMVTALKVYRRDTGAYPTAAQGLAILLPNNPNIIYPSGYRAEGYLNRIPKDINGGPFEYRVTKPNNAEHYLCPNGAGEDLTRCRRLEDEPDLK